LLNKWKKLQRFFAAHRTAGSAAVAARITELRQQSIANAVTILENGNKKCTQHRRPIIVRWICDRMGLLVGLCNYITHFKQTAVSYRTA